MGWRAFAAGATPRPPVAGSASGPKLRQANGGWRPPGGPRTGFAERPRRPRRRAAAADAARARHPSRAARPPLSPRPGQLASRPRRYIQAARSQLAETEARQQEDESSSPRDSAAREKVFSVKQFINKHKCCMQIENIFKKHAV